MFREEVMDLMVKGFLDNFLFMMWENIKVFKLEWFCSVKFFSWCML